MKTETSPGPDGRRGARRPGVLALGVLLALAITVPARADSRAAGSSAGSDGDRATSILTISGTVHGDTPSTAAPGPDGRCPDGREPVGDLGIKSLRFEGSMRMQSGEILWMSFLSEPQVLRVDEKGPAAGKLRPGDEIVSIDGKLITTSAAGRIYANPPIGEPLAVVVRRGGKERTETVVPVATCPDREESWPFAPSEVLPVPEAPPAVEALPVPGVEAAPEAPPAPAAPVPGRYSTPRTPRPPAPPRGTRAGEDTVQREAERADRAAERLQREVERVDREAAWAVQRGATAYERALRGHERSTRRAEDAARAYERALARAWVDEDTEAYTGLGLSADDWDVQEALTRGDDIIVFQTPPEVFSVDEDSPAERAGVKRGDVVLEVDGVRITTREGSRRLAELEPERSARLTVRREGRPVELTLVPEKRRLDAVRLLEAPEPGVEREPKVYRLRYAGHVGDAQVEVHGIDDAKVGVTEEADEIVIETEEATITVRLGPRR